MCACGRVLVFQSERRAAGHSLMSAVVWPRGQQQGQQRKFPLVKPRETPGKPAPPLSVVLAEFPRCFQFAMVLTKRLDVTEILYSMKLMVKNKTKQKHWLVNHFFLCHVR